MSTELENVKKQEEEYSASNIQVLEGLEAVRKRPAMYIGDIGDRRVSTTWCTRSWTTRSTRRWPGYCSPTSTCTINEDNSITVKDNGRGIPTDYAREGRANPALEVVLTVLHAGGKFDKGSYKVSGRSARRRRVAASTRSPTLLVAESPPPRRQDLPARHTARAPRTRTRSRSSARRTEDDRGTIITFKPDGSIFTRTTEYEYDTLAYAPARAGVT